VNAKKIIHMSGLSLKVGAVNVSGWCEGRRVSERHGTSSSYWKVFNNAEVTNV